MNYGLLQRIVACLEGYLALQELSKQLMVLGCSNHHIYPDIGSPRRHGYNQNYIIMKIALKPLKEA